MKKSILHTAKILLLLFVLTAPVALVAGKNEMTAGRNSYHSSEAIKRIIHYNISTVAANKLVDPAQVDQERIMRPKELVIAQHILKFFQCF